MKNLEGFSTFKPDGSQTKGLHIANGNDAATVQIKDFVETTIGLKKEKTGLGISIVGGDDTHLGKILISGISPKGAAGKDGRLQCGDQILSVNESDLQLVSHDKAVQLLRMAKNPVRLVVYRENIEKLFTSIDDPEQEYQVVLRKGINDSIGLGIYARKDGRGIFVTYIAPGTLAESSGLFEQGDRILQCNGKDLRSATQHDAVSVLKNTYGEVRLLIGRGRSVEDTIIDLIEDMHADTDEKKKGKSFQESRLRSRSDCMSTKKDQRNDSKRRTVTMNETVDPECGSMLELISHQPLESPRDFDSVNFGYIEDEPQVVRISKNKEHQRGDSPSQLKSTLRKDGKRGHKRLDHVSFEMTKVQDTRASVLMYGDSTGV